MRRRLALLFVLGAFVALAVPAQTANPPRAVGSIRRLNEMYLAQAFTLTVPPPRTTPSSEPPTPAPTLATETPPLPSATSGTTPVSTPATLTTVPVPSSRTVTRSSTSSGPTNPTSSSSAPSPTQSDNNNKGDGNQGLIVAGAAIGGLVFAAGLGILVFKIIVSRRERQQRQKEFAAALSDSYYPGGAANALSGVGGSSGYRELHDDNTSAGGSGGANLSREGSYNDNHYYKESGGYSQPYVQERYGGNNGTYGMYEETEMSVIGGPTNGSGGPAYPPTSMRHREDYDYGYGQPPAYGNYGGGGGGGGGYDNYSYGGTGKGHAGY